MWIKTSDGALINLDTGNTIGVFEKFSGGRGCGVALYIYGFDAEGGKREFYNWILLPKYSREVAEKYFDKLAKKLGAEEV